MKITWLGHAAFLIETEGDAGPVRIITDPFSAQTGYAPIDLSADIVTLSHHNPKYHSCLDDISGQPRLLQGLDTIGAEVELRGLRFGAIQVYENAAGEGPNAMLWCEAENIRLLHMGDVGHPLDDAQLEACGIADVLLAPAGGSPTIALPDLLNFVQRLQPRVVIPMHYGTAKVDMNLLPVTDFTGLFDTEQVQHHGSELVLNRALLDGQKTAPTVHILQHAR